MFNPYDVNSSLGSYEEVLEAATTRARARHARQIFFAELLATFGSAAKPRVVVFSAALAAGASLVAVMLNRLPLRATILSSGAGN